MTGHNSGDSVERTCTPVVSITQTALHTLHFKCRQLHDDITKLTVHLSVRQLVLQTDSVYPKVGLLTKCGATTVAAKQESSAVRTGDSMLTSLRT